MKIPIALGLKGERVICPKCSLHVATLTRDIFQGQRIEASMFYSEVKQIRDTHRADCPRCNAPWIVNGSIHLKRGWT